MKDDFEQSIILNQIIEEMKQFKNEKILRCPNCQKILEWDDGNFNPEDNTFTCQHCRFTEDESTFERIDLCDYVTEIYLTFRGENYGRN